MNGFLLDTNTVSELVSVRPNQRVLDWIETTDEDRFYLSVMTFAEMRQGVSALPQSKKRTMLENRLEEDLPSRFTGRILTIDREIAERWGCLMAESQAKGVRLPVVDCLLAATALHHNLTIATRNVSDFRVGGLSVLNPWDV